MAISIKVNKTSYEGYLQISVTEQLDAICKSFSIDVATLNLAALPFKGNELCEIFVDDELRLTGRLEINGGNYSAQDHNLRYQGRDNTRALVDSTLASAGDIVGNSSLKTICEKVIAQIGAPITVETGSPIADFNKAEDNITIEGGDGCFDTLQKYAVKRQVLLTSTPKGNLLLTQNTAVDQGARLQNILNSNTNNVLTCNWNYDNTGRFNAYIVASVNNPLALNFSGDTTSSTVVGTSGRVTDDQVEVGRQFAFKPGQSMSATQCDERAKWELNMRKARSRTYSCVVSGHTIGEDSDVLWSVNTLVSVIDVFAGIDAIMLVNKVTFVTNLQDGDNTQLELIPRDSYTTKISEPKNDVSKVGNNLFGN